MTARHKRTRSGERGAVLIQALIAVAYIGIIAAVITTAASNRQKESLIAQLHAEQRQIFTYYHRLARTDRAWTYTESHDAGVRAHVNRATTLGTATAARQSLVVYDAADNVLIPAAGLYLDRMHQPATAASGRWLLKAFWVGKPGNTALLDLDLSFVGRSAVTLKPATLAKPGHRCTVVSQAMTIANWNAAHMGTPLYNIGWIQALPVCPAYPDYPEVSLQMVNVYANLHPANAYPANGVASGPTTGICSDPHEATGVSPSTGPAFVGGYNNTAEAPQPLRDLASGASIYNVCYGQCCSED